MEPKEAEISFGGGNMETPFDIFWFGESGPIWIKAAQTIELAKKHIEKLPHGEAGGYVIVDQRTGKRTALNPDVQSGAECFLREADHGR